MHRTVLMLTPRAYGEVLKTSALIWAKSATISVTLQNAGSSDTPLQLHRPAQFSLYYDVSFWILI